MASIRPNVADMLASSVFEGFADPAEGGGEHMQEVMCVEF